MSVYAIGDLHLSFNEEKPMDIFGQKWKKHEIQIEYNWLRTIKNDDLVILPGDFSWAINIQDALKDFQFLNRLPGKKVFIKGNHDYWWTTLKSMYEFLDENEIDSVDFIMNNAIEYENVIVVGTRGWSFNDTENSEKMLNREVIRLKNSINYAKENFDLNKKIICAMHYPPITKTMVEENIQSDYLELLKKYDIKNCLYGHLHGMSHSEAVEGAIDGVNLKLVSSDYLNFIPYKIA
ncbi:MAG: metallophosphoesterase [Clostridia bacterium]|nr:metallophosphoesterase [Clostridia bacterium]